MAVKKKGKPRRMLRKAAADEAAAAAGLKTHAQRVARFIELYKQDGDLVAATQGSCLSGGQAKDLIASHPELREDIISLLNRLGCTPERIVQEQRRIAFSDPRTLFDADGEMLPVHQWPEDAARAVSGIDVTVKTYHNENGSDSTETTYKPKLWDKNTQLKELAKMQNIAGAETQRVGNVRGETLRTEDEGKETREKIMLSLLNLVQPRKDPEEKGK